MQGAQSRTFKWLAQDGGGRTRARFRISSQGLFLPRPPTYLGQREGQGCVAEPLRASRVPLILDPEKTGLLVSWQPPDPLTTEGRGAEVPGCLAGAYLCNRKGGR